MAASPLETNDRYYTSPESLCWAQKKGERYSSFLLFSYVPRFFFYRFLFFLFSTYEAINFFGHLGIHNVRRPRWTRSLKRSLIKKIFIFIIKTDPSRLKDRFTECKIGLFFFPNAIRWNRCYVDVFLKTWKFCCPVRILLRTREIVRAVLFTLRDWSFNYW